MQKKTLNELELDYQVIWPQEGYARAAKPALAMSKEARARLLTERPDSFFCSGWVEYRISAKETSLKVPPSFAEDIFGEAAIVVLAPCIAIKGKIRITAHISGDLSEVFPYLNSEHRTAILNAHAPYLTIKDGYRDISLFPKRIGLAKADDLPDAWRVLEMIRCMANDVWQRRAEITPSYEIKKRVPTLEIYRRLPRTNCGQCGQKTCFAFAAQLYTGSAEATQCRPVFEGEFGHLQHGLLEVCAG
jgi:ArsR family metal-binding transcriptional regulator